MKGGLLVPEDGVLYPPCAARFFTESAQKLGAKTQFGVPVSQIGESRVALGDGSEIRARFVVNAAGTSAPDLTPGLAIKKRKGHLVITERYPGFVRHQLVELGYLKSAHSVTSDSVAFNVQPRRTGQLLIGSSRQYGASIKKQTITCWSACCSAPRNTCRPRANVGGTRVDRLSSRDSRQAPAHRTVAG